MLLAEVQADFTDEELIAVGLASATGGQLVATPAAGALQFFPEEWSGVIDLYNFATNVGRYGSFFKVARVREFEQPSYTLLASSEADAHVLIACGFRVLPAQVLLELRVAQAQELYTKTALGTVGLNSQFFLAATDLAGWRRVIPEAISKVLARMRQLRQFCTITDEDFLQIWSPSNDSLQRLRDAVELREPSLATEVLESSMDHRWTIGDYDQQQLQLQPLDLLTAHKKLHAAIRVAGDGGGVARVKELLDELLEYYQPRHGRLDADQSNPITEPLTQSLKIIHQRQIELQPEVKLARRVIRGDVHAQLEVPSLEDAKEAMQTVEALARLYKSGLIEAI